ncbi:helix-turn-helix domain-containing protein [Pseudonocardia phyllosphaerae]|uniref:helix-turn-helix domain-containing protein n=1 Tax=Pseudonocardia phyllosphaerae TaxID=3390502 RepID=UPI00397CA65E
MTVVEQRYRAVLAVEQGEPRCHVAAQFDVSRQTLSRLLRPERRPGRRCGRTGAFRNTQG